MPRELRLAWTGWGGRPSAAPSQGAGPMGGTARIGSRDGRLLAFGGAQLLCVPAADPT